MDELNDPVQLWFTDHVDTVYRSLDSLQAPLSGAAWSMRDTLLGGGKLLVGGNGTGCALAQLFTALLLSRLSMERPPLPVVQIGGDAAVMGAIADGYGFQDALARHMQAIASPGDTVLLIGGSNASTLLPAIRAAHAREAKVIVLGGLAGQDQPYRLGEDDIELRVPSEEAARVIECQLLVLNCLVGLVERGLFGNY